MQDRYFVEMADGQRFGPADVATLKEWAAQGRLHPSSTLVSETTGERLQADSVAGLFRDAATPPPPHVGGPTAGTPPPGAYGSVPPTPPRKNNTMIILLAVFGVGGLCLCSVFAAILFPVFAQAKVAAQRTQGLSGIKKLATGIALYSADHDDVFPLNMESASALQPVLTKYVPDVLAYKSKNPEGGEILGDERLSGQSWTALDRPAQSIMLYDSLPWKDGRAPVAFADTSARLIRHETIAEMLKRHPVPSGSSTE